MKKRSKKTVEKQQLTLPVQPEAQQQVQQPEPAAPVTDVKVTSIRLARTEGVHCFCSVHANGITFTNVTFRASKKGFRAFWHGPSQKVGDKYIPEYRVSNTLYEEILKAIEIAFNAASTAQQQQQQPASGDPLAMTAEVAAVTASLYSAETEYKKEKIRTMANGAVRGVTLAGVTYITQNVNKASKFAEMAKAGHKVIHLVDEKGYIGHAVNGVLTMTRK